MHMHGMAIEIPGEEAAPATTRRLNSHVWRTFRFNPAPGPGGAPMATCRKCYKILSAGNGTSHLSRHPCHRRAAVELPAASAADEPGDHQPEYSMSPVVTAVCDEVKELYSVDGMYIPGLYDKLVAEGLVNVDQSTNVAAAVPQAASSSTRWFIKRRNERQKAASKERCAPDNESASKQEGHS